MGNQRRRKKKNHKGPSRGGATGGGGGGLMQSMVKGFRGAGEVVLGTRGAGTAVNKKSNLASNILWGVLLLLAIGVLVYRWGN